MAPTSPSPAVDRRTAPPTLPLTLPLQRDHLRRAGAPAGVGTAWIVRAVTHVPGVLRLEHGRLGFVSTRGSVFDVPLDADVDLSLPRYGSGAFRLTVGGERLRVHVVRPAGAVPPAADLLERYGHAGDGPVTRGETAAGEVWRALLRDAVAPRPAPSGGALRTPGWRPGRARRGSAAPSPRS